MSKCFRKYGLLIVCLNVLVGGMFLPANAAVRSIGSDTSSVVATESKSCYQRGYRLITCPVGRACLDCTDGNNKKYLKLAPCNTSGYVTSCPADKGQVMDPTKTLACWTAYSKCKCDNAYTFGGDRETCDKELGGDTCTIGSNTYYKTCKCSADYSKACTGDYVPVDASDKCDDKYKSCKCDPEVFKFSKCDHGVASDNKTCTEEDNSKKYSSCKSAPTCVSGGYVASVPENEKCTAVTYEGLDCYKDCVAKTCVDGDFIASVPAGKTCTETTYSGLTCYKDCENIASNPTTPTEPSCPCLDYGISGGCRAQCQSQCRASGVEPSSIMIGGYHCALQ